MYIKTRADASALAAYLMMLYCYGMSLPVAGQDTFLSKAPYSLRGPAFVKAAVPRATHCL